MALASSFFFNATADQILAWGQTFLECLLVCSLLCKLCGRSFPMGRGLLFSGLISLTILLPPYAVFPVMLGLFGSTDFTALMAAAITVFRNPLWLVFCNFLMVHVLGLRRQSVKDITVITFCTFQMITCLSLLGEMSMWSAVAHFEIDILQHRYLCTELLTCVLACLLLLAWGVATRYMNANLHKLKVFAETRDGIPVKDVKNTAASYVQVVVFWMIALVQIYVNTLEPIPILLYLITLIFVNGLAIFLNYHLKFHGFQTKKLLRTNQLLLQSVDEYRSMRHAVNNMLQVYDGYLLLEDFEGLRLYHQRMIDETAASGGRLQLVTALHDHPEIFEALNKAIAYAVKMGVQIETLNAEALGEVELPDHDLCSVLNVLLNNAVEHAARTEKKTVLVSAQNHGDTTGLVMVSNSVDGLVATDGIFKSRYSTKEGHEGAGLPEVDRILSRHYGCTILPGCSEDTFTMMLNVPFGLPKNDDPRKSLLSG